MPPGGGGETTPPPSETEPTPPPSEPDHGTWTPPNVEFSNVINCIVLQWGAATWGQGSVQRQSPSSEWQHVDPGTTITLSHTTASTGTCNIVLLYETGGQAYWRAGYVTPSDADDHSVYLSIPSTWTNVRFCNIRYGSDAYLFAVHQDSGQTQMLFEMGRNKIDFSWNGSTTLPSAHIMNNFAYILE